MPEFSVFYSWQSDLPTATNWTFIEDGLKKACKAICQDPELDCCPTIDRDTKGVPGAPAIPAVILEKIDNSDALVADVSLCYKNEVGERSPNPNVLFELGYAISKLGWERIALVVNEEFGTIDLLPFDLDKRRAVPYRAKQGEADRSESKKNLSLRLEAHLRTMILHEQSLPAPAMSPPPADLAIEAIDAGSSAVAAKIRDFWKWIVDELALIEPNYEVASGDDELVQLLETSLERASPVLRQFTRVVRSVSFSASTDIALRFATGFESILSKYDFGPDYRGGQSKGYEFDYWKCMGYELFVVLIAVFLGDRKFELASACFDLEYMPRTWRTAERGAVSFDRICDYSRIFEYAGKKSNRTCYLADLLQKRYAPEDGELPSFAEFIEADLLIYIAASNRRPPSYGFTHWRPWSTVYLSNHRPRFVSSAKSSKFATGIAEMIGIESIEEMKHFAKERFSKLSELWSGSHWYVPVFDSDFDAWGTTP